MHFIITYDTNSKLKNRIMEATDKSIDLFLENCPGSMVRCFTNINQIPLYISINKKSKNVYGWASFSGSKKDITGFFTEYSQELETSNKKQLYFIVAHEIAHCLDFLYRGDSHHDKQFYEICGMLGSQPARTIEINLKCAKAEFPEHYKLMLNACKTIRNR